MGIRLFKLLHMQSKSRGSWPINAGLCGSLTFSLLPWEMRKSPVKQQFGWLAAWLWKGEKAASPQHNGYDMVAA